MATNIFNFDGTLLTTVADGAIDTTHASIKFPGKGYQNYGEPVLEDLLWVMQNFAGTNSPSYPSKGQLWYDTNAGAEILKVWTGVEWAIAGGVVAGPTDPGPGASQGAFWYDTTNKQLKTWNGTIWDIVGPLGSKVNNDPLDPPKPTNSLIEAITVKAQEDGLNKQVWRISVGGTMLAILSKEPAFTPQSTIITSNGFAKIFPGINFSTTVADASIAGDSTIFKSTQNNLPNLDAAWDLGSSSKKFKTVYGSTGRFTSGLCVGTNYQTQYNFQVNGVSKFDNTINLAAGTLTTAPLKFTTGQVITPGSEQLGAVEFDGNNFYFTSLLGGIPTRRVPLFGADITAGKVIYVSDLTGNDLNDGRTRNTAYKTIKKALTYLTSTTPFKEGYTIFVETGEYLEQNPLFVPARTSIVGDNLRRVIVRPVHNRLDLFHVEQGTYFFGMTFKDHRAPAFCFSFPCSTANAVISSGTLQEIQYLYSPTGYNSSSPPEVFIEPPAFSTGGTRATATADVVDNAIVDVIVTNGGTGYDSAPGAVTATVDPLTTGGGFGAEFTVRVNDAGKVVAVDIVDPGENYGDGVELDIIGAGGSGATVTVVRGNGVIRQFVITNPGSGYSSTRPPHISIKGINPPFIASSPYVQNCSSITGPFDTQGKLITTIPPYDTANPGPGYTAVDPNGAGAGLRIDGELVSNTTVVKSFVADSFTQFNQGGIGHLIINKGYTQFVSCFTTFSSVGYWARSGGFCNISNSVIDFGDYGLRAEGYYPVPYVSGTMADTFYSTVAAVDITDSGYGYSTNFPVAFSGGIDTGYPGAQNAQGIAIIENQRVVDVQITVAGDGYTGDPGDPVNVDFSAGAAQLVGVPNARPADGAAVLQPPLSFDVEGIVRKPQFGSGLLVNNQFHIIRRVTATANPTTWSLETIPPVYSSTQGSAADFHDISNISSGGLALEYVGSGTTYNALPVYGGNPVTDNQVQDGETNSSYYPGRVYYVTIDNTGDFKVGQYFAVNFIDGTVKLNANAFELTNVVKIGPFRRNGVPVGTYCDEISYDATLTHLVNPGVYDQHTVPTQSAVRGYMQQITTDVKPAVTNVSSLGTTTLRWQNIVGGTGLFNKVGIGLTAPASTLDIYNDADGAEVNLYGTLETPAAFRATRYSEDDIGAELDLNKTRGSFATPLTTEGEDITGTIRFRAKGTSAISTAAAISAKVDVDVGLPVSTAHIPGKIVISTTDPITTNLTERMVIDSNGKVGIATSLPDTVLHVEGDVTVKNGEIRGFTAATADGQFRAVGNNYGVILQNDDNYFYMLQTNSTLTPESATYNSTRPFYWNLSTGEVTIDGTGEGTSFGGNVNITTASLNASAVVATGQVRAGSFSTTGTAAFGVTTITGNTNITGTTTVTGELRVTQDIIGFYSSDARLKDNLAPITDALAKVQSLDGVTFNWNQNASGSLASKTEREAGVIAQQVEKVLPEVVVTRDTGYKAVNYEKLVPLLIEAIKELSAKVEKLEKGQ